MAQIKKHQVEAPILQKGGKFTTCSRVAITSLSARDRGITQQGMLSMIWVVWVTSRIANIRMEVAELEDTQAQIILHLPEMAQVKHRK